MERFQSKVNWGPLHITVPQLRQKSEIGAWAWLPCRWLGMSFVLLEVAGWPTYFIHLVIPS